MAYHSKIYANRFLYLHTVSLFFFTVSLCLFAGVPANAQANLLINPGRVVFEKNKSIQELNLANTGSDTARYLISFIEIRMNENGTFDRITQPDSGQNFASSSLRVFPKSVVLGPGEAQVVKVQVIKPAQLQPGEYRSHIYFRGVPNEKPLGETEAATDSSGISVHLIPIFGISIPVIIRVGESTAQVNLSDLKLDVSKDSTATLDFKFNRTGNMSVYGDLDVEFISAAGKHTQVGRIKGIALYTPTASRQFKINLIHNSSIDYKTGTLHVVYKTQADAKSLEIAKAELILL